MNLAICGLHLPLLDLRWTTPVFVFTFVREYWYYRTPINYSTKCLLVLFKCRIVCGSLLSDLFEMASFIILAWTPANNSRIKHMYIIGYVVIMRYGFSAIEISAFSIIFITIALCSCQSFFCVVLILIYEHYLMLCNKINIWNKSIEVIMDILHWCTLGKRIYFETRVQWIFYNFPLCRQYRKASFAKFHFD